MEAGLTVSERILYHLLAYLKYEEKYEVPFDITQDGISQACGISRAHAAIELKKLKDHGEVLERLTHIRRGKSRRKAYFLAQEGKARAYKVAEFVRERGVESGVDASKIAPGKAPIPTLRIRRISSPIPTPRYFFGRTTELDTFRAALESPDLQLVVISGISGVGKTTFLAQAARNSGLQVFWQDLHEWDTERTVAEMIASYFATSGLPQLQSYLDSGRFELGEFGLVLSELVASNGHLFIIDDLDRAPRLLPLIALLRKTLGPCRLAVAAEEPPAGLFEPGEVSPRGLVRLLPLEGLDPPAAQQLLEARRVTVEDFEQLYGITQGHPLALELVGSGPVQVARQEVFRYLEESFYAGLSREEQELLEQAAVFRQPFPATALPREIRSLRKGSLLREVGRGLFTVHALLRDRIYDAMGAEHRRLCHSRAADFHLDAVDPVERLYHLLRAGRTLEAEMALALHPQTYLDTPRLEEVWRLVGELPTPKPRYAPSLQLLRGRVAAKLGKVPEARESLSPLVSAEEPSIRAEALIEIGLLEAKAGLQEAASGRFSEALSLAGESGRLRARALRSLGNVAFSRGRYQEAEARLEESVKEALATGVTDEVLKGYLDLGNLFIGRGDYPKALEHFLKCATGFGPADQPIVQVNLGVAYAHLGEPARSRAHFEQAIELAHQTGQSRTRAYALSNLADLLVQEGELSRAREACFEAIELLGGLEDRVGLSAAYANLGAVERRRGALDEAESALKRSLELLEGLEVPRSTATRLAEYAELLKARGDTEGARREYEKARQLFASIDAADMVAKIDAALR